MAEITRLVWKFHPSKAFMSSAMAYMEMPEAMTVMIAKAKALNPRVFSSNRSFRYSGTERAFEP